MPPQKTQPAQVITDGDLRLAKIEGLFQHTIAELHTQNETLAEIITGQAVIIENLGHLLRGQSSAVDALTKLDRLADEVMPLLESPAVKFMAQRRALKHKAATGD